MFRPKTNRERAQEQEALDKQAALKWQAEQSKYLAPSYVYSDNSREAVREHDEAIALERAREDHARWEEEQARKRQQENQQQIDQIKESGIDGITAAAYYATAVDYYNGTHGHSVNKPLAAQTFWQALVCGEGRAAFDLFHMLYNGDGIAQNQELARPLWSVANRFEDPRAAPYKGQIGLTPTLSSIGGSIFAACNKAATDFTVISPEALAFQTSAFNAIMNTDKLTTDFVHHTMPEYLVAMDELPHDEVVVSGDSDAPCLIL